MKCPYCGIQLDAGELMEKVDPDGGDLIDVPEVFNCSADVRFYTVCPNCKKNLELVTTFEWVGGDDGQLNRIDGDE